MSRIVRNSTPSFIWTLKRDDIDFQYLRKEQIANHYTAAWTFTTKSGLCTNLHNIRYFDNVSESSFFPRCYRLCCDDEKDDFIDDFRLTAAQGFLKVIILKNEEWRMLTNEMLESNDDQSCDDPLRAFCGSSLSNSSKEISKWKFIINFVI